MEQPFLTALLGQLEDFRQYPKYQYERRIDAFIGFFLPDVLRARYKVRPAMILPEFPVKAHNEYRLSKNIDYALYDQDANHMTYVELKTDRLSVSEGQLSYYIKTLDAKWDDIAGHIRWVREGSEYKNKYDFLLNRIGSIQDGVSSTAVYLAPSVAKTSFHAALKRAALEAGSTDEQEQARWQFLSLRDYSDTNIDTPYNEEWHVVREAVRNVDA